MSLGLFASQSRLCRDCSSVYLINCCTPASSAPGLVICRCSINICWMSSSPLPLYPNSQWGECYLDIQWNTFVFGFWLRTWGAPEDHCKFLWRYQWDSWWKPLGVEVMTTPITLTPVGSTPCISVVNMYVIMLRREMLLDLQSHRRRKSELPEEWKLSLAL